MAERSEAVEEQAVRDGSAAYSVEAEVASTEDVPPGYKRTEVGVIPEDWEVTTLGALCKAIIDGTHYTPRYVVHGVPFYSVENVSKNDFSNVKYISEEEHNRLIRRCRPEFGDILMTRIGSLGATKMLDWEVDASIYVSLALLKLRDNVDQHYIYAYSKSDQFVQDVEDRSLLNASPKKINMGDISAIPLPIPPQREEQHVIATALSDADALIESLDRLIVKKRAIKQAAMQQLLTGQTRLPGFTGEWETKRLGEISTIAMGRTPSRNNTAFWGRGHVWLSIADLHGKVVSESKEQITNLAAAGMTPIPEGTLLMSFKLSIGRLCFAGCDLFTNEAICSFTNLQADAEFIYYALGRTDFSIYGKQAVKGYTLNSESLKLVKVLLPPENEQIAIAAVLSDMDTEIEALLRRRDKARQIKQGMMQQLLTGRVRLVNSVGRKLSNRKPRSGQRKANVHFMRSVFAAEIVDQLHQEPTFGHVKLQKVLFLAEHLCDVDTGSTYNRKAAGPYDNRALRSIDSQMHRQRWFEARKEGGRYRYIPLDKRGYHKEYFDRYFCHVRELFAHIVEIFRKLDTERCEIVATLYSAWDDLLREQAAVSDEMIIHEVLNNWHESKNRIPRDRWAKALSWMREMGFVPKSRLANE